MFRGFIRSAQGKLSIVLVMMLLLVAIVGPWLFEEAATQEDFDALNQGPSRDHPLGTDGLGRDILARVIVASRLSIVLSLVATVIAALVGLTWGAATSILPARLKSISLRLIDAMLAFPGLLVALFIGAILGPGARTATVGVAVGLSFSFARVTSSLALSLAERDYVSAARVVGVKGPRLVFRHILPNAADTLAITLTVALSTSMAALSTLSFLGLGVQLPDYDWGSLLTTGVQQIYVAPAAAFGPAAAILVAALSYGFLGEALARAMNPVRWPAKDRGASRRTITTQAVTDEAVNETLSATDLNEMLSAEILIGSTLSADTLVAETVSAETLTSGRSGRSRVGVETLSQPVALLTSADRAAALARYRTINGRPLDRTTAGAHSSDGSVLEVEDLTVSFPSRSGPINVVNGVSFNVAKGEMVGIAGESGSGKTMTAMAVAGLVAHPGTVGGTVRLAGLDVTHASDRERRKALASHLAVVFQDPMSSLNPALTIGTQMTQAVRFHQGVTKRDAMAMAAERLGEVNIPVPKQQLKRYPHELSGGMRQRVMIAMGLMNTPALLIADEPTTALDLTIQAQLMDVLHRLNEEHGMAVLLISHNLGLLSQNCSRVLTMYSGGIVEQGPSSDVLLEPLHPYTRALLGAAPNMRGRRGERLESIPGQPPEFSALPGGCVYHPRCMFAMEHCKTETPPVIVVARDRHVACWLAHGEMN